MMQTFIYNPGDQTGDCITVSGAEAHHIASVLRLGPGDMVRLIDGRGTSHVCEISESRRRAVTCRIIKTLKNSGEPSLHLTLAIGLSGSAKFDVIIEKATEVGVSRFIPLLTEKARVKVGDRAAATRKMRRWRRVCEAAVKQSARSVIPDIAEPIAFDQFIEGIDPTEAILFHPGERVDDIAGMTGLRERKRLTLIVGPESGFDRAETDAARSRGIALVSLGPRTLRTETAGIVLPALCIYYAGPVKA